VNRKIRICIKNTINKVKSAALISLLGMPGPISGQASEKETLEAREKAIIPIAALTATGDRSLHRVFAND